MGHFRIVVLLALTSGLLPGETLRLSLKRAVEIALSPEGSARLRIAGETVMQAQSRAAQARGALLPDLEGSVSHVNQTRNLEALGIQFNMPIPLPAFVGPFNVFDARASVRQNVFDFSSIRRYQAAQTAAGGAQSERSHVSEQVSAQVARAYMAALKSMADVEAAEANVDLARAVVELVEHQKRAGTGTGIEITRARVQLANEEQRLLVLRNERRRADLQLLRAIGLRLDTVVELEGKLAYSPAGSVDIAAATERALDRRADFTAQAERERSANLSRSAVTLERLPSVAAFADYGPIGNGLTSARPTHTVGVSLRVPVFDGGRRDARRTEAQSQHRQEQLRTRDLREQIELEVRLAHDALAAADEQVRVASEGLKLSESELTQAQRRYKAGVATSIEVTDAQTRMERARDNYTSALFAHNIARVDLAVAQGAVEDILP